MHTHDAIIGNSELYAQARLARSASVEAQVAVNCGYAQAYRLPLVDATLLGAEPFMHAGCLRAQNAPLLVSGNITGIPAPR